MKRNGVITTVIAVATAGFVMTGCKNADATQADESIRVKLLELKRESVTRVIATSGQFSTEDEAFLSFKTGGVMKSLFVKEGERVRQGQMLAALELTEINAAVTQAKAALEKATRDYQRVENLFKDSVTSLSQFQDAKTALDVATQQLTVANFNLTHSEIRALADGYVLKTFFNEGQLVGPGMPVIQTNGAGKGHWILKVGVSDRDWSEIAVGDKAAVECDAMPGTMLEGRVRRKSEGIDPLSGTFSADVKVIVPRGVKLASGLFGRAAITLSKRRLLWAVPYESVLEGNGSTGYVFVTSDRKKTQKIRVHISGLSNDKILIDEGLEGAGELIVSGSAYLAAGSAITIAESGRGTK